MSTSNLFLALFPDRYSATQLTHLAKSQRARHRLRGKPLGETRFHLSLHRLVHLGYVFKDLVRDVSVAAEETAGAVPPFEVKFDRVCSFRGSGAFVLWSPGGNNALLQFREALGMALRSCGAPCDLAKFQPHVTLLYDDRAVVEEVVEPVNWVVNEFVLVRSVVGETKYDLLERWKLRG